MTSGYITLPERATPSGAPGTGKTKIEIDSNGDLVLIKDDGKTVKLAAAGSYTLTIPATGTAALRDVAQTFSAQQTFDQAPIAPGMKPASDSTTALKLMKANGDAVITVDTTNGKVLVPYLEIGDSNYYLTPLSSVGMLLRGKTNLVADGGTLTIGSLTTGFLFVLNQSDALGGLFLVRGGANTTVEMLDISPGYFSTTKDTPSSINCYYESGQYTIQNKRGANKNIVVFLLGTA